MTIFATVRDSLFAVDLLTVTDTSKACGPLGSFLFAGQPHDGPNAQHAQAHANLGAVLLDQGRLDQAIACFRRSIAINPRIPNAFSNLGSAYRRQSRLKEAVACFSGGSVPAANRLIPV